LKQERDNEAIDLNLPIEEFSKEMFQNEKSLPFEDFEIIIRKSYSKYLDPSSSSSSSSSLSLSLSSSTSSSPQVLKRSNSDQSDIEEQDPYGKVYLAIRVFEHGKYLVMPQHFQNFLNFFRPFQSVFSVHSCLNQAKENLCDKSGIIYEWFFGIIQENETTVILWEDLPQEKRHDRTFLVRLKSGVQPLFVSVVHFIVDPQTNQPRWRDQSILRDETNKNYYLHDSERDQKVQGKTVADVVAELCEGVEKRLYRNVAIVSPLSSMMKAKDES